jgi:hypothetical protein
MEVVQRHILVPGDEPKRFVPPAGLKEVVHAVVSQDPVELGRDVLDRRWPSPVQVQEPEARSTNWASGAWFPSDHMFNRRRIGIALVVPWFEQYRRIRRNRIPEARGSTAVHTCTRTVSLVLAEVPLEELSISSTAT